MEIDGLREKIGFVTQDAQLFSGSIRENLLFVRPGATDAECMDVLKQASVHPAGTRRSRPRHGDRRRRREGFRWREAAALDRASAAP